MQVAYNLLYVTDCGRGTGGPLDGENFGNRHLFGRRPAGPAGRGVSIFKILIRGKLELLSADCSPRPSVRALVRV